ncbi:hypothetical protein ACI6Q5_10470 [Xanthomonas codiaei]|uniref:Uncharacterized protein n=1 Tax=Xanthomonas codiaei TaxID=56463 RepID=A0ABW9MMB6_9XANT|nr:hypothetical protein [Xanthomonas codiaei]
MSSNASSGTAHFQWRDHQPRWTGGDGGAAWMDGSGGGMDRRMLDSEG